MLLLETVATDPLKWLPAASGGGVLAFMVMGFLKGWIIPGPTHDRVVVERNRLLELTLASTRAASRAVDLAHEDRREIQRIAGSADEGTS